MRDLRLLLSLSHFWKRFSLLAIVVQALVVTWLGVDSRWKRGSGLNGPREGKTCVSSGQLECERYRPYIDINRMGTHSYGPCRPWNGLFVAGGMSDEVWELGEGSGKEGEGVRWQAGGIENG